MSQPVNRRFRPRQRDRLRPDHRRRAGADREPVPDIGDGQALGHTLYLSLDASNRLWTGERRTYLDPMPPGGVMRGLGVGQPERRRRTRSSQAPPERPGPALAGNAGDQATLAWLDLSNARLAAPPGRPGETAEAVPDGLPTMATALNDLSAAPGTGELVVHVA